MQPVLMMRRFVFFSVLAYFLFITAGCTLGQLTGDAPDPTDNALQVEFERPPDEAISEFRRFISNKGVEVKSVNGNVLKTEEGTFGPNTSGESGTSGAVNRTQVRIVAAAEPVRGGSELVIVGEYLDRATGNWERAEFSTSATAIGGGAGSADTQAFQKIYTSIVRRYGTDNIKHISSDLNYSSQMSGRTNQETENQGGSESVDQTTRKNQGGSDTQQTEVRERPKYGIGLQWAAPAFGVSGMYNFTNRITGQAVLGFIGGLQTYAARGLYRFKRQKTLSLYGYGTLGAWRYSGALTSSSALGFGGGVGVEYGWGQLYGNLEMGYVGLSGELAGYNDSSSSVTYGIGIHYKFDN